MSATSLTELHLRFWFLLYLCALAIAHHDRAASFTTSLFQDCMIIAVKTETARELTGELIEVPAHRQGLIDSRAVLVAPAKLPGLAESSVLLTGPARSEDAITVQLESDGVPIYRWNDTITADIEAHTETGRGCPAMSIQSAFEGITMPLHEAVWCEYVNWWTSLESLKT